MSGVVDATRDQVAALAETAGIPLERDPGGDFFVHTAATTAFVQVSADADDRPLLEVWAPVVVDVDLSADLLRFAAETSFLFGRLAPEAIPAGAGGRGQVVLTHTLVGDPLNADVLLQLVGTVANTADQLAAELPARFGGRAPVDAPSA